MIEGRIAPTSHLRWDIPKRRVPEAVPQIRSVALVIHVDVLVNIDLDPIVVVVGLICHLIIHGFGEAAAEFVLVGGES